MRYLCLAAVLCLMAAPAFSQTSLAPDDVFLRYGLKAGVQVLDSFQVAPGFNKEDTRFVGGGMLELRLNDYFGGEVDALYRRFRFDAILPATGFGNVVLSTNRADAVDFPVLFKWKPLGHRTISPYVDSGVAFRYINGRETRTFFAGQNAETNLPSSFAQRSSFNVGWVIGGGVVFEQESGIRIAPEVRYTVWGRDNFRYPSTIPGAPGTFSSTNNQLEVLLGVTF